MLLFMLLEGNPKCPVQEGNEISDDSQFLGELF